MRKVLVLVAMLALPVMVTKAQDKPTLAPIVALADNKLYAVSAEDGSAKVIADVGSQQTIGPIRLGSISPDGKQFVYSSQSNFDSTESYTSDLYLVTIADATTQKITPSGGIYDVPVGKDEHISLDMATWSWDGQRIYYYRGTYNTRASTVNKPTQFGYYDVATGKHELVARIDPKNLLDNLQAVPDGMVARWYKPGFNGPTIIALYNLKNQIVKQVEMAIPYLYALRDKDALYYAQLHDFGDIDFMIGARDGDKKTADRGYYPAAQSVSSGEKSMHVFSIQGGLNTYHMYGADYHTYITSIDNPSGFTFALAPDGQHMAYILFDNGPQAPIYIMDMKGKVRKLEFEAMQIVWGATEFVPFLSPG